MGKKNEGTMIVWDVSAKTRAGFANPSVAGIPAAG